LVGVNEYRALLEEQTSKEEPTRGNAL